MPKNKQSPFATPNRRERWGAVPGKNHSELFASKISVVIDEAHYLACEKLCNNVTVYSVGLVIWRQAECTVASRSGGRSAGCP